MSAMTLKSTTAMRAGWRATCLTLLVAGSIPLYAAPSLAQGFDGYGVPASAVESFVDQYGREVYLDAYGRIVAVVQRGQGGRGDFNDNPNGPRIFDGPPPPGVTLEGPVNQIPPGVFEDGPRGGFSGEANARQPQTIDPYDREDPYGGSGGSETIEALPLPDTPGGEDRQTAELPRSEEPGLDGVPGAGIDLPEPGAPIVQGPGESAALPNAGTVEGQTIIESDPAPQVATPHGANQKAEIAALQVLLDRAGMSPGVIDGQMGSNVNKAVAAYEEKFGRKLPTGDSRALADELNATGGPPVINYELTAEDVAGPYVASIPSDYAEKAQLPAMSFERPTEKLAERFHMDEAYLKALNPGADFSRPGTQVKVANTGENVKGEVVKIIADKGREQVRAYDAQGQLVAAYPSTIGSSSTPSPSGTVQVNRIAFDPNYTYNPKINFKQGENDKVLTIPPGPNGPVGTIWIALSKPTYGIHGTPEPSKIGKTNSHGCIRLTNWDAYELAKMVKPGVTVEFIE